MVQIIKGPTHRARGLKSTIDLGFTNEPRRIAHFGQIATGSEHDCCWIVRQSQYVMTRRKFEKRSFRNFDKKK